MAAGRSPFRFFLPALFALSLTGGAAADKGVDVTAASAPAGTDRDGRLKAALRDSIRTQVSRAGLASRLRGYSISPALIQLRRFIEPGKTQSRTVCVVELALHDTQKGFVANVRGNASGVGANQLDTLTAAAQAAVNRLPETLSALQRPDPAGARVGRLSEAARSN